MIEWRDRVLPDQRLLRNQGAKITDDRAHIAMRQLEPCPRERVGELIRMLVEAPGYLLVGRVQSKRQVCRQHGRHALLRRIERIWNRGLGAFCRPLVSASRALR